MAIQVNIDGINKTVTQPQVNIDGTWKTVSKVQNNIDGVWKTSFQFFTVKIYRYGSLYQTLKVAQGNSVRLPSLGSGFATSSGSTATSYSSGATITPTSNMNLYAVFSYNVKIYSKGSLIKTLTSNSQSTSASFTLPSYGIGYTTSSSGTTVSYNNGANVTTSGLTLYALYQYSVKLYQYGSLYTTLTSNSTGSTGSFTLPSNGIGYASSSSSTTVSYNNGSTISSAGTTLYIVYEYNVKLYNYGTLVDTLTAKSQASTATFKLPTCTVDRTIGDTSFYGWTKTSGATEKDYSANQSVSLGSISLYAVFAYNQTAYQPTQSTSSTGSQISITLEVTGQVIFKGYHVEGYQGSTGQNSSYSSFTLNNSATAPYIKIGDTYLTGSIGSDPGSTGVTKLLTAGTTIKAQGTSSTKSDSTGSWTTSDVININYPNKSSSTTYVTAYRSTK